jgi:hypothetical protein
MEPAVDDGYEVRRRTFPRGRLILSVAKKPAALADWLLWKELVLFLAYSGSSSLLKEADDECVPLLLDILLSLEPSSDSASEADCWPLLIWAFFFFLDFFPIVFLVLLLSVKGALFGYFDCT